MAREEELLRWLRRRQAGSGVRVGIGDDAALVRGPRELILKVDSVVEGVHFERAAPARIGHKAMARPLSDLAGVAGLPLYALVSLVLPSRCGLARARSVYLGAERTARRFGVRIVGGDVVSHRGPLTVTVTIAGRPGPAGFIRRSGARPGDHIFVTGALGGSLLGKHLRFQPRIREAQKIAKRATAMIDISDGFAIDLHRLCEASGVGAEIDLNRVPISAAARRLSRRDRRTPLQHALGDGEDYELLYTARRPGGIGRITRGRAVNIPPSGWNPSI